MAPAYALRRQHRERMSGSGQMFFDQNQIANNRYLNQLPDSLQARPPTLPPHQMCVYKEDMHKLISAAFTTTNTSATGTSTAAARNYMYSCTTCTIDTRLLQRDRMVVRSVCNKKEEYIR